MAVPLLLTSGPARCEAVIPSCGTGPVCLFHAIATLFQLYHGADMIIKMKRRKLEPTHLLTQGIFNLWHHIGMVWEELAFGDTKLYTVMEIQIGRGDGMGNRTTDLQMRNPTYKQTKKAVSLTTQPQRTPLFFLCTLCYFINSISI